MDTCSQKDNKKMDANTVWQWRIMQVQKSSPRHPEPFHYSNEMGLDFNVGSNIQKKLDIQLLTNGVILEICDFAKTVNKSKQRFITNILENNFDLGLKNEQQRIEFTSQILHKVRDLIRKPPEDKHESFPLFDLSSKPECASNSQTGLDMASTEHKTDSFLVDTDDTDESEREDEFKSSREPSKENIKTEEQDGQHADDSANKVECSGPQSTEELKEDVLPPSFPCCEEIGLNLDVGTKQSLDPALLTKGVMLELAYFARVLTASCRSIVLSVLEHNFELDLKRQQEKNQVWFKVLDMLERKEQLIADFKSEPFSFQTKPLKKGQAPSNVRIPLYEFKQATKTSQSCLKRKQKKRVLSRKSERLAKRQRREQAEQKETSKGTKGDHHYMCPLDSDEVTDSEYGEGQDDIPRKPKLSCDGPFVVLTDCLSSLSTVNLKVNPPFASQPDKTNVPNRCDMEQEEMETETNMWKLRANRGKQIFLPDKEYCAFKLSKRFGLEFDVGFGPKRNFSVDSMSNSVLLEVAKFALAMNSSQEDFIMEILEYNFELGLKNKTHRRTFASEVMNRVKQLKNSEDAVKFSKEVFELPGPTSSVTRTNQSTDSVNPELGSISRPEESDVAPMCPSGSHAEAKKPSVDLYPFCNEIGLKLNVISSQPNKKLEINKLTNGAMTEVTNFAEKLCGTFEQICLDILKHNLDLDWKNQDSDLGRDILAQIPVIIEQRSITNCLTSSIKLKQRIKDFSNTETVDCQNNPNLDTCGTDSSKPPIIDQTVGSSTETEQEKELNSWLWKLRADQIQQILSVPHGEHCPFYSYSRCKKAGIDFNVGSGVRQNLDPKLLTNGIMVELYTFATALESAQRDFITEILEYNFHLKFNNEHDRSCFAQIVMQKFNHLNPKIRVLKMLFKLPDLRCLGQYMYPKTKYCPKCYQDRKYKICQDESDPGNVLHPRPLAMTNPVSVEANSTAQKSAADLSSTFRATEETIMESYPCCKKIGLSLCVDKDQPRDPINTRVLTVSLMREVASFARRLCGTKIKIINDIIEHNFILSAQSRDLNPANEFRRQVIVHKKGPTWFSEVFLIQRCCYRDPANVKKVKKVKKASATQSERKELIKKRQLALQTKKEEATLQSDMGLGEKKKKSKPSGVNPTPICTEIGLDLDLTSTPDPKKKLKLKLLTRAVVMEIYKFVTKKPGHYLPDALFEILDYNFDLRSQHERRWEFSLSTASKVKALAKTYRRNIHRANMVFKLPFVLKHKASKRSKERAQKKQNKKSAESSGKKTEKTAKESIFVQPMRYHSDVKRFEPWFDEDTESLSDLGTIMQMTGGQVSADCDSVLQGNVQIKEEEHDPHYGNMTPELDTKERCPPYYEDIKTESNTEDAKYLVQDEPAGFPEYTFVTICPNSESNMKGESEMQAAKPQVSEENVMPDACPNTVSSVNTEWETGGVKYVVPVEAAGSQGYSMITICQDPENTRMKEEQRNVPFGSYHRQ